MFFRPIDMDAECKALDTDVREDVEPQKSGSTDSHPGDAMTELAHSKVTQRVLARGLESVQKILASSDTEITSRAFILERIREFGISYNEWPEMWQYQSWRNLIDFGLVQIPTEFTDYLMMLIRQRSIKTAIEIGVWRGASSYITCAVLQRLNRNTEYIMVDTEDQTLGFDEFSARLNLRKEIPATALDFEGREFDLVFIDGDHSYGGIQRDYVCLGIYAKKIVAFHDIQGREFNHLGGGPVRFWSEFRATNAANMMVCEFMHSQNPWMGIGMGIRNP